MYLNRNRHILSYAIFATVVIHICVTAAQAVMRLILRNWSSLTKIKDKMIRISRERITI